MKIHLRQIPLDGLHLEGEEDSKMLDLQGASAGPIRYALDVGVSGSSVFATGRLEVDLELECVACLEKFPYPLRVESFAMQEEVGGSETVDLTPCLREDILLALPAHPHCDWNGDKKCSGVQRENPEPAPLPQMSMIWEELDKLNVKKKN
jgi:uncharacterized protein